MMTDLSAQRSDAQVALLLNLDPKSPNANTAPGRDVETFDTQCPQYWSRGDLWWFMVIYSDLWWFIVIYSQNSQNRHRIDLEWLLWISIGIKTRKPLFMQIIYVYTWLSIVLGVTWSIDTTLWKWHLSLSRIWLAFHARSLAFCRILPENVAIGAQRISRNNWIWLGKTHPIGLIEMGT